jgi:hypothetical protein
MATQWGRKETVIWPVHIPVMSYSAVMAALLFTCLFIWQILHFSLSPVQQSYIAEYVRSQVGAKFNAHEDYRLIYLGGVKMRRRLALPVDITQGKTTLPDGRVVPVALAPLATAQGYRWYFRAPERKFYDASMHRWLSAALEGEDTASDEVRERHNTCGRTGLRKPGSIICVGHSSFSASGTRPRVGTSWGACGRRAMLQATT